MGEEVTGVLIDFVLVWRQMISLRGVKKRANSETKRAFWLRLDSPFVGCITQQTLELCCTTTFSRHLSAGLMRLTTNENPPNN